METLQKLFNYFEHVIQRALGFPLRDRSKDSITTARVIYPTLFPRKKKP
jgi:hypothetical protein